MTRLIEKIPSEEDDTLVALRGYEILTYPADFTLEVLAEKWKKKQIRLPGFQRKFMWTKTQSSKLIESFLLGLPVPPIFLYQDRDNNELLVVDGQQRLKSIVFYFSGVFGEKDDSKRRQSFNLNGLHERSPYLGRTYEDLGESDKAAYNKLNDSVLRAFVMKQLHPEDDTSIFQVFERLNTGGVVLQPQEIRNCIYEGEFNNLLISLNTEALWRDIVGTESPDKRMRDVELILRFFALFHDSGKYDKPMKKFLNDFMDARRKLKQQETDRLRNLFMETAQAVTVALGAKPFHIHRGLNTAVFDAVFTVFGKHKSPVTGSLKRPFRTLLKDKEFIHWTSRATTDKDVVPKRILRAEHVLFGTD